jgi:hypothetical protein
MEFIQQQMVLPLNMYLYSRLFCPTTACTAFGLVSPTAVEQTHPEAAQTAVGQARPTVHKKITDGCRTDTSKKRQHRLL